MNPNIPVSEIMTKNLITGSINDPVVKVMKIFDQRGFHHLPIVKNGTQLVGIISKEDIQKVAYLISLNVLNDDWDSSSRTGLTAGDIMTRYPLTIDPDDSIGLAADIFMANRFHALPVVDGGELVGIVTSHDLISHAYNNPVETTTVID